MAADDEGQIRELLANMAAGYRAKDAERIVASYAPDMLVYNLAPPLRTRAGEQSDIGGGRLVDMATADGVRTWLAGFGDQPFDYEIADLAVAVGGDVAFAHGLGRMGSPGAVQPVVPVHRGPAQAPGDLADHPPARVRPLLHGRDQARGPRPDALSRMAAVSGLTRPTAQ